jgi:shikimate kinase
MKVVLLGYMASGKSAVGRLLAKELNMQFIDLDEFIEEKEELTISEIFKTKGEIYFRIKEGEYLKELLNLNENISISLGGGTPCYGNNIEIIEKHAISFYLNASINTIYERLIGETSKRPLVATLGENNLKEFIAKHLFERNPFYERANFTISVNDKSISEVAKTIQELLIIQ